MRVRTLLAAAAAIALLGTAERRHIAYTGSFKIAVPAGPFVSGSRINVSSAGVDGPVAFTLLGPGALENGTYVVPSVPAATHAALIGSARGAVALQRVDIVPAPAPNQPLLAVATYDSGVALHDPRSFRLIGYLPIGGAPGDVTFDSQGRLYAPDTDGDTLAAISRSPWQVRYVHGVDTGNEVAVDPANGDVFVSNRDAGGTGALTRIARDGALSRVKTGDAAEGLAIDAKRGLVYVGNVNGGTASVVDAKSMRVVDTIPSVERTFGIALDAKMQRLFVVSNTSPSMPTHGGYVAAIDVGARKPHIVRRSARLFFPVGAALDRKHGRLFVTDEARDVVYVLGEKTLGAVHAPLRTCATPWRPLVASGRLFVPCANADKVDVFDLQSLRRVSGAPFATGGYPLSVALWVK
jgi:DNA-binding beta-propeller fold protein YncE